MDTSFPRRRKRDPAPWMAPYTSKDQFRTFSVRIYFIYFPLSFTNGSSFNGSLTGAGLWSVDPRRSLARFYFATDEAMFGLLGFTITSLDFGTTTKSIIFHWNRAQ
uniref:Uncharacterized protein n=1 Tax=Candidatus Kentrum sp. UNK TaxID=2126344 RepID=A0A451APS2_9GAMM|nr:MAG: hypothetical protein BECKUNK1418G_GA0071005_11855 [Candidatus Kentron sp. UNK]